jgi:hypothetical protein
MQRGRPARPQRDKQAGNYMELAETSRILRVVASVPPVTFPPTPSLRLYVFIAHTCRCATKKTNNNEMKGK